MRPNPILRKFVKFFGAGLGALILIYIVFFLFTHNPLRNPAQEKFKPIGDGLKKIGAQQICDNGDSGKGIDNTVPWYQVYYSAPQSTATENQVKFFAANAGYTLIPDVHTKHQVAGLNGYKNTTFLKSKNNQLTVSIVPPGDSDNLYCSNVKNYGQAKTAQKNEVLLDFRITLPG
ncbi:MAG TPA: hypothetical protein VFP35_00525 [Candidatus Saccharimonadales bacterium]|nr:hypothetical protein [Candidatus Saccharimonadales bacterium]